MSIAQALKEYKAIELASTNAYDLYLLDNNRVVKYDRFYTKSAARWVDEDGNVFKNFVDAYNCSNALKWA